MNRPSFGEKKTFCYQYRSHIRVNRSLIVVYRPPLQRPVIY